MAERDVEVEVGLDPATMTRARTRFVARRPAPEPPREPELGDPWCALTVRGRLLRYGRLWRKVPHTPDTRPQQVRSCMPETVKEIFKDQKGEPMRLPVPSGEFSAARLVLDTVLRLRDDQEKRDTLWAIATGISDREMGRLSHIERRVAGARKQALLDELAKDWNARGVEVLAADIAEAKKLIHRKFK